jgi:molybdopterin-guanine dinucleotide biosynthesis protein B
MIVTPLPLIGFAAYSGTGKTTLLCKLIPLLKQKGIRIGVIKHAHHDFDIDFPQKDSYKLRKSGADTMLITSCQRTAIISEHIPISNEPSLEDALNKMPTDGLDLLLVEGFKKAIFPKIELHRQILNRPYLYPTDPNIIAIACDDKLNTIDTNRRPIRQFDLNQPQDIADFIATTMINT